MPAEAPLSRPLDPHTSSAAADHAANEGVVDSHEWLILQALRWALEGHGTASEITRAIRQRGAPLDKHQVLRRVGGMVNRGQLHRRTDPATGRYRAKPGDSGLAETILYLGPKPPTDELY